MRLLFQILLFGLFAAATPAGAQNLVTPTIEQFLRAQTQGLPGKVMLSVGQLDPRTQLTPCNAMEPFLPSGGRLWGKATVGVRCLGPANWTVYVPVEVKVNGNYLVTARAITVGQPIAEGDFTVRNGDLTNLPASILTDPAQALGKMVKHGIGGGQPLRGDLLIAPYVVQQGQSVRLISKGAGFSVSSEGKSLSNAAAGQIAQVRTAAGQVVSGVARTGGVVEISY